MAAAPVKKKPTIAARRAKFLKKLAQTANVSLSARYAGIATSTVYEHRAKLPSFAKAWDVAIGEALDALEHAVIERAASGVERAVFFGGKQIGTVRNYSDALAMFMLRARRPEVYARLSAEIAPDHDPDAAARAEVLRRIERLAHDGENTDRAADEGGADDSEGAA